LFQHRHIFEEQEAAHIETNILVLKSDISIAYQKAVDASHYGHPIVMEAVRNGQRGRPRIVIEPNFLRWAYSHRGASGIGRFLGVSRTTVRNSLLYHGIAAPGHNPFPLPPGPSQAPPEVEHPFGNAPPMTPTRSHLDNTLNPEVLGPTLHSSTVDYNPLRQDTRITSWTDNELDEALRRLRIRFPKAGISILRGQLERLGHHVPKERIRLSLLRIDPVRRVFERIRIGRRTYKVAGPNSLWHHDGQHGMCLSTVYHLYLIRD